MGVTRARRGRPPLPAEAQRRRLLDAARRLLDRGELEGAGVRELVAEAGMSSRAFYELFESKDALILELARQTSQEFLARFESVPEPSESFTTEEMADRLLDPFIDVAAPLIAFDGARLNRHTAEALHQIRDELREAVLDALFRRMERAVEAGRLTHLPDRVAYEILIRGAESLAADRSRQGRLAELAGLRGSMRALLLSQAPLVRPAKRE